MTTINDFSVTDDVTDNLASYHNRLLGGVMRAEFANTETISATKELADSDCQFQILTAGGANRDVELAPEGTSNHITVIYNSTPSSDNYNLVVKDDSGATTYKTLAPDKWDMFIPISGEGWKQLPSQYISLQFGELAADPADSTTYYTGQSFGIARGTSAGRRNIQIPVTGTIVAIYGNVLVTGTLGSAETSTVSLRLNDTTDTTISSTVVASALNNQFNGTGLGVAVVPGDTVEIKWVTPAWATNPTAVVLSGTILIQL